MQQSLSAAAEQRLEQWDVPQSEIAEAQRDGQADYRLNHQLAGFGIHHRAKCTAQYVRRAVDQALHGCRSVARVGLRAGLPGRHRPGEARATCRTDYGRCVSGRTFSGRHLKTSCRRWIWQRAPFGCGCAMANPGLKLKPGMFVNVDLKTSLGRQLVVPASAVFQSGTRQLVFLDHGNGSLEPKEITVGPRVGDDFVVLKGTGSASVNRYLGQFPDRFRKPVAGRGRFVCCRPAGCRKQRSSRECTGTARANIDFTTDPNPPQKGSNVFRVKANECRWTSRRLERR